MEDWSTKKRIKKDKVGRGLLGGLGIPGEENERREF